MKVKVLVLAVLFTVFGVSGVLADTTLFEMLFNKDGTLYGDVAIDPTYTPVPVGWISGFNTATGIGTVNVSITGAGAHSLIGFFDLELNQTKPFGFSDEYGYTFGAASGGQSWEIDEPGFGNPITFYIGDIYGNVKAGTLDKKIFDGTFNGPEDVAMALGWDFILAADQTANIALVLSRTEPSSGFYLKQSDDGYGTPGTPDYVPPEDIYFSSTLDIRGGGEPIPEPATMLLLGSGLVGLAGFGRRKLFKK